MISAKSHQLKSFSRRLSQNVHIDNQYLIIGKSKFVTIDNLYNAPYLVLNNLFIVAIDHNYLITFNLTSTGSFERKKGCQVVPIKVPSKYNSQRLTLAPTQYNNQFYVVAGDDYLIKFSINEHSELSYFSREVPLNIYLDNPGSYEDTPNQSVSAARAAKTCISRDGRYVLTEEGNLFDIKNKQALTYKLDYNGITGRVELIRSSHDSIQLLILPYRYQTIDTTIKIAKLTREHLHSNQFDGEVARQLFCEIAVNSYAISHDSNYVAVSDGHLVLIYHIASDSNYNLCEEIQRTSENTQVVVDNIEFSCDNKHLIIRSRHRIEQWDCYEITANPFKPTRKNRFGKTYEPTHAIAS